MKLKIGNKTRRIERKSVNGETESSFFNHDYFDNKYKGDNSLKEIELFDGITKICEEAFMDCIELKKIVIPESVEWIDPNAFIGCTNLTEIILPDTVEKIEYHDQRGVFSITEYKPFPNLITNLVEKGLSVQLKEDSWSHWD